MFVDDFLNAYYLYIYKNNIIKIFCIIYITYNTKMNWFEYIITVYNSFVNMITEVQLDTNDVLNDYGGI